MNGRTIARLARLREIAVEQAARGLGEAIAAETAAREALRAQGAAINAEIRRITDVAATDPAVEAFGAWLRRARAELRGLAAQQERAEAETARARAELNRARTALEAVTEAAGRLAAEQAAEAERKAGQQAEENIGFRYATTPRIALARDS